MLPEEAELIAIARRLGELTLTLRNPDDADTLEEHGRATINTLLSGQRTRVLSQKRFHTIQVIRGSEAPGESSGKVSEMYLKHHGVNPTLETASAPVSTFAADVDTGSYTLAREWLGHGELPHEAAVRVEEFVNAFDYAYRPPQTEPFAVQVEVFPSPHRAGFHLLHVGVQGKQIAAADRKSANLVFAIDISGSMAAENRLGLAQRALALLVGQLGEADTVALVVYGTDAQVVLAPTPGNQRDRILEAIANLRPEGSTNAQAGIELAYDVALKAFKPGGINRVVLCSDGVAKPSMK